MRYSPSVRAIFHTAIVTASALIALAVPAHATRCLYPGDSAVGVTRQNIQSAMNTAMASWERAVAKRHGRKYGHWEYAADGTVDCTWNSRGRDIRCRARAVACAE